MKNNKKKGLIVSSTVVGLVCGLALTQQQAKAATVDSANDQNSTIVQAPKADKATEPNTIPADVNSNDKTTADDSSTANVTDDKPAATTAKDTDSNVSAGNEEANKQTPTTKAATTPELIDQGIEGTSKWEFKKESNDYVLYIHEGTIYDIPSRDNRITKIVIDPGVKSDGPLHFGYLENLTTIEGLSNIDTSKCTDMSGMFQGCKSLKSLDLSHFDTSNVTTISQMFAGCSSLKSLDLSNFNTSNFVNLQWMFQNCTSLENLNLSGWVLPNAGDMQYMFSGCSSLKTLDLSSLKAPNAFYLNNLFAGCTSLTSLDLRNLKIRDLYIPMNNMFLDCKNLNHLVLGTKVLFSQYAEMGLPDVPAVGTLVPGTNKKVTAPYWVATSGYEQGKQYTSDELMKMESRDAITTYDWVAAAPVAETSTESRAVSRLINIHQPDDTTKTITQTAMIKRQVNTNEDGSIDYGAWSTATWEAYDVPVFAGYSASSKQIPAAVVDGQTQDQVVDIFYEPVEQTITVQYLDNGKVVGTQQLTGYVGETITPNYHVPAGYELAASPQPTIKVDATGKQVIKVNVNHKLVQSTEIKTFTRTINVHQPDGTIKTINQVAVVRRTVTIDQATGKRTTGSWHTDIWEKYRLPQIAGYTPTKSVIPTKVINANSQNERVDVYYKANK
ncbi:BspA family leucine-rich repeat surface protein [Lactobacillus sp. B4026]|uniref:BspA family leucine-rich repeat surface protein n=1 Tax=Lactobacillus sp. B4026 TaxID=2818035 RepID=UPI00226B086A|nr:BspA family leucine-rich repeat surface protein [Lactobacillus sp. B4026]MCX8737451.1 BspA family leucine-rich repeat surface protein [Lactobacillus sp. B4026]